MTIAMSMVQHSHLVPHDVPPAVGDGQSRFVLKPPANKFNLGELYNLSIRRGTLTAEERYHINEHIGGTTLVKLTPANVQACYAAMEKGGASARVRQLTHAVLHRALKQAVKWNLVPRNVCDAVEPRP